VVYVDEDRWQPDDALAVTVRTRCLPISTLEGPDRAWAVAALTVDGWTVSAIADRLKCSLRLIQQIKAEPMTMVAVYALACRRDLRMQQALHRFDAHVAAAALSSRDTEIARLRQQRDTLLGYTTRNRKTT
jgi:hypothetical protein